LAARAGNTPNHPVWVDPLIPRLFRHLGKPGVRWGLHKTRGLLDRVGSPDRRFDVIHVGGTNGKGSVSALLASVLRASGHRVGLYTSPHLVDFAERIQVDGAPLKDDQLLEFAATLEDAVVALDATFFEATTALAFHAFAELGVDIAVVEVGLGGRLDSTNVVDPLVTVITNIGMDHAHYLGDTLVEIAREKAGIIKAGVPVVTAATAPDVFEVIQSVATERGAPCALVTPADLLEWSTDAQHTRLSVDTELWGTVEASLSLAGSHQALNGAVAIRALERLPARYRPTAAQLSKGLAAARWPGRFERRTVQGRYWMFDVAHNLPGVEALLDSAHEVALKRPWIVVMGVLNDKDWAPMAELVAAAADVLILTVPPSFPVDRRWDPGAVLAHVLPTTAVANSSVAIEVIEDLAKALDRAAELAAASESSTVFVTGSCHTVGDAFLHLGIRPFR